jgi:hypothetical protein
MKTRLPICLLFAISASALETTKGEHGLMHVTVAESAKSLSLPTPFPNIVRVPEGLILGFNKDASEITLSGEINGDLDLETSENSQQFGDGRWVLSALDATVKGQKAKLETHPGSHRIGFWADIKDSVTWTLNASRPGMYDVNLTYSLAGGTSDINIGIGAETLNAQITHTGSWYRYRTVAIGRVYIPQAGKHAISVACGKKTGGAVMNLKALLLDPAPEGEPVTQADDGVVLCHSSQATVHGTKLQYEHNPKKITLGYWVNASDWAHWDFSIAKAGDFGLEVLQGCGKGQGGSDVALHIAGKTLPFVVQDTGHFQNFKPRVVGRVSLAEGPQRLEIRPIKKAKNAVMDVRQIRLIPAK